MVTRQIISLLQNSLARYPILVLHGARQTGKTALAGILRGYYGEAQYFNLERISDFRLFIKPDALLQGLADTMVIIDNVHRNTSLLTTIYPLAERMGAFVLLTAEPLDELELFSRGCAEGKIGYVFIPPLALQELLLANISMEHHWTRGGFAGSLFAPTDRQSMIWRDQYIAASLERQNPVLGVVVTPYQLRLFWLALAQEHGHIWNASGIARATGFSPPTALTYRLILEDKMVLRALPAFQMPTQKRLTQKPVVYIRDSGLLHATFKLQNREKVLAHFIFAFSWKGYVVEQIITALMLTNHHNLFEYWHYRTHDGAECDLVITKAGVPIVCVYVQCTPLARLSKKIAVAVQDLNINRNVIILPAFEGILPIAPSVYVMNLLDFLSVTLPEL